MKKKLLSIVITLLSCTFLFAQNNDAYLEFLYKNPFLDDMEVYTENPDALRGKILKIETEAELLTIDKFSKN